MAAEIGKESNMDWKCECLVCGHKWITKKIGKPLACPKCKRYDWETYNPRMGRKK